MFTGIIPFQGKITAITEANQILTMHIQPAQKQHDMQIGESVCISGICLSLVAIDDQGNWVFECMPETRTVTAIQFWQVGDWVNCERAMQMNDRFGGHMVQGHVDGIGKIIEIIEEGDSKRIFIQCPQRLLKMIPEKGYITIDGMSLTIVSSHINHFSIALIPLTLSLTTAKHYHIGQHVNCEIDITTKTIMHLLHWEKIHV